MVSRKMFGKSETGIQALDEYLTLNAGSFCILTSFNLVLCVKWVTVLKCFLIIENILLAEKILFILVNVYSISNINKIIKIVANDFSASNAINNQFNLLNYICQFKIDHQASVPCYRISISQIL